MTHPEPIVPEQEAPAPAKSCTNCGHRQVDVYCASCGEKQPDHHELTVGHFAHEAFHELVHLDSKLFRTLRDLVARPGELTAAYFAGRKKRYIAPLRLFLTLYAIQFLAYSAYKPIAIYSLDTMLRVDQTHKFENMLKETAAKRSLAYPQLVERIEHRWQKNMSLVSLLSIAVIAGVLQLLYLRRRRFLAEHLVFSTHYMCFAYVMSIALWPVYLAIGVGQTASNYVLMVITSFISIFYLFHGMRRVYAQGGGKTIVKSVIAWAATFVTTMLLMGGSLFVAVMQVLRA